MSAPEPGVSREIEPGLRTVLAPNAGPMTHWGTNSFILGEREVAIIDPGPDDPAHYSALLNATKGETVTHILVTHAHTDHSPLAHRLSENTGAPILGFGPPEAGRSMLMSRLAAQGLAGGGEGVDRDFLPDRSIRDGERIAGADWTLDVLHTPGHFAGHLAFRWSDLIISGDHVMDWASSLVSPPDGDISAFMATSLRLHDLNARRFLPGHGNALDDPVGRLGWLIEHRRNRGITILNALTNRPETVEVITARVYRDTPPAMLPAAARNVFAHLIELVERGHATATPALSPEAAYSRT